MKTILIAVAFSFSIQTFALSKTDSEKKESDHRLSGLVELQSIIGVGKVTSHQKIENRVFPSDTVFKPLNSNYYGLMKGSIGYKYKEIVYVGAGTGIQFGRNISGGTKKIDQLLVPVFLETRLSFPKGKVQPYFNQAIGYSFYFDQYFNRKDTIYESNFLNNDVKIYQDKKNLGGLFLESTLGVKVNLSKVSLNFGCGYNFLYMPLKYYYGYKLYIGYPVYYTVAMTEQRFLHHLVLSVGVSF